MLLAKPTELSALRRGQTVRLPLRATHGKQALTCQIPRPLYRCSPSGWVALSRATIFTRTCCSCMARRAAWSIAPTPSIASLRDQTARAGVAIDRADIDHIIITHLHPDHCDGLESLLLHRRFILDAPPPHVYALPEVGRRAVGGQAGVVDGRERHSRDRHARALWTGRLLPHACGGRGPAFRHRPHAFRGPSRSPFAAHLRLSRQRRRAHLWLQLRHDFLSRAHRLPVPRPI